MSAHTPGPWEHKSTIRKNMRDGWEVREMLYGTRETIGTVITASVWRNSRGELQLHLQESTRDAMGCESFMMFGSWSPTVAREKCARVTEKAITAFYAKHRPEAVALVAARVAVLEQRASEDAAINALVGGA